MAGLLNSKPFMPTSGDMENMSWNDLYQLRVKHRGDQEAQQAIAPFEHQAYAREQVKDNPITAAAWAVMPAGYQAAKALGLTGPDDDMSTPPSMEQAMAGMKGVLQGIGDAWKK